MSDEYPQSYEECQRIIDKKDASKRLQKALAPGDLATQYQSACDYAYELENLVTKYMAGVISREGSSFIEYLDWNSDIETTPAELAKLRSFAPAAWKLAGYDEDCEALEGEDQ